MKSGHLLQSIQLAETMSMAVCVKGYSYKVENIFLNLIILCVIHYVDKSMWTYLSSYGYFSCMPCEQMHKTHSDAVSMDSGSRMGCTKDQHDHKMPHLQLTSWLIFWLANAVPVSEVNKIV